LRALEQQADETSRQNASHSRELEDLSTRYKNATEQQRLSELHFFQLQAALQSIEAAVKWSDDADDEKQERALSASGTDTA
jgi:predicted  nucleic acid-binding Zn-ribbon protein